MQRNIYCSLSRPLTGPACLLWNVPLRGTVHSCLAVLQQSERRALDSTAGDGSVVEPPDSWSKGPGSIPGRSRSDAGRIFRLLRGQLSVLALIPVSVPPPCYRSSIRSRSSHSTDYSQTCLCALQVYSTRELVRVILALPVTMTRHWGAANRKPAIKGQV